jgi:hypothetical protein
MWSFLAKLYSNGYLLFLYEHEHLTLLTCIICTPSCFICYFLPLFHKLNSNGIILPYLLAYMLNIILHSTRKTHLCVYVYVPFLLLFSFFCLYTRITVSLDA